MRRVLTVLILAGLTACASTPEPDPPPPPPPREEPPPKAPPPPPPDTCGARDLQWLVGQPKSKIPVPIDPSKRRVACTTCPVTMDFSPTRLNIFFDETTGIVKEVRCG